MGIFGRLWNIGKGKAHDATDAVEEANFGTVVRQGIRDMKDGLNKTVKAAANAMSHCNRLESEYESLKKQSSGWHEKAKKALGAGKEELAKKALSKKAEVDGEVASIESAVNSSRGARDKLKKQVDDLKRKISDAERNANTMIARKNAAKAQKEISQSLAGIDNDSAFSTLKRMEESVAKEEAQAKAFDSLASDGDSDLEDEFAKLEVSDVDDEMAALKAEMAGAK